MAVATQGRPEGGGAAEKPHHVEQKAWWNNWAALSTVILAVCATLSAFRVSSYATKAIINQSLASNHWAYFQSKSIKEHAFELQRDHFEIQAAQASPEAKGLFERKVASYNAKLKTYADEKATIQEDAKKHERLVTESRAHSSTFGFAVTLLQIAILISSIGVLTRTILLWYGSLVVGLFGLFYFVDGFTLFF